MILKYWLKRWMWRAPKWQHPVANSRSPLIASIASIASIVSIVPLSICHISIEIKPFRLLKHGNQPSFINHNGMYYVDCVQVYVYVVRSGLFHRIDAYKINERNNYKINICTQNWKKNIYSSYCCLLFNKLEISMNYS